MKIQSILLSLFLPTFFAFANDVDCKNTATTVENNACVGAALENENKVLTLYLNKAKERYAEQSKLITLISSSQKQWLLYRQSHCDAIYTVWSDGSIRAVMFGECMLKLTKQRTHQIWEDYLTYMDNTPPLLPEP
ncbi:MAG: lysozyme inhibitor LprI family protein [Methylotenera sp.]|jgi:uncharacterized protein YecT (DUF1311 family)